MKPFSCVLVLWALVACESAPKKEVTSLTWYASDLHVHATGASNDTGGNSWPRAIKAMAQTRGLDVVILTDHSNSAGSDPHSLEEPEGLFNLGPEFVYADVAKALSAERFLMLSGSEISPRAVDASIPTGHIGCIPTVGQLDWTGSFTDRPRGAIQGQDALADARLAGCFTVLNHPYAFARWIAYDWTSLDYDALEVWNGGLGYDLSDHHALAAWACDLSQGRWPTMVSGSDNHRVDIPPPGTALDPALGTPTTWIGADTLDHASVMAALRAHRTSVSDTGSPLLLTAMDRRGEVIGYQGDTLPLSKVGHVHLVTEVPPLTEPRVLRLYFIEPDACLDHRAPYESRAPEPRLVVLAEQAVEAGVVEMSVNVTKLRAGHIYGYMGPVSTPTSLHRSVAISEAVRLRDI